MEKSRIKSLLGFSCQDQRSFTNIYYTSTRYQVLSGQERYSGEKDKVPVLTELRW